MIDWASTVSADEEPDLVIAAAGTEPELCALGSHHNLAQGILELKIRFVNVGSWNCVTLCAWFRMKSSTRSSQLINQSSCLPRLRRHPWYLLQPSQPQLACMVVRKWRYHNTIRYARQQSELDCFLNSGTRCSQCSSWRSSKWVAAQWMRPLPH